MLEVGLERVTSSLVGDQELAPRILEAGTRTWHVRVRSGAGPQLVRDRSGTKTQHVCDRAETGCQYV